MLYYNINKKQNTKSKDFITISEFETRNQF